LEISIVPDADPAVSTRVYEGSRASRVTACLTLPLVAYLCVVGGQALIEGRGTGYVFWLTLMLTQWLESFVHAFDRIEVAGDECTVGRFHRRQFPLSQVVRWSVGAQGDIRFETVNGAMHASSQGVRARGDLLRMLLSRIPVSPLLKRGFTRMGAARLVISIGIPAALLVIRTAVLGGTTWTGFTNAVAIAIAISGVAGLVFGRWNPKKQQIPNAFSLSAPTATMMTALCNLGFCVPMVVRSDPQPTQNPLELIWLLPFFVFACAFWLSRRFWPSRTATQFVLNLNND